MGNRKKYLKNIKKMVIKIGSSSLTSKAGGLDKVSMKRFVNEVSSLIKRGMEVIIVTSGAIAAGLENLNIKKKPEDITLFQAAASIGQVELMRLYSNLFLTSGLKIGQILLTHEDTTRRKQYLNIKNTIKKLISLNIVPVINENDSVAVDEIKFGDNDELAALVAILAESDILIILTDIDGMYDKNPRIYSDAKLISYIDKINEDIEKAAGGIGSTYGIGGMESKIKAAKICSFSGIKTIIANSKRKNILNKIIAGEDVGTFFAPQTVKKVKSIKKWIAFGMKTKGGIVIDRGAEEAVLNKGKSILAVGVVKVDGKFNKGDTLKVFSLDSKLIAKGISNFSSEDIEKIKGKNRDKILSEFDTSMCSEVIHRDCLVVFKE
ncbi:MAG: glutamate 5-kinase [Candidatus Hydromicrobium sp.]|jgi:glutamate 5-kinase|nr:glutamate 5-kinase [Chloroflexota bacterium]MBE3114320.1 glutamate 5-kinase [Actinomycetota bacterium]MCJ7727156.1 glutamate 5-kinase [Actinomycetota bacterium]MDP3012533.1 glutamate 5-kinase [Candidatus Hydromicrobium sp.]